MPSPSVTIAPDSHSARMLRCLKEVLSAKGIRYADVALLLNVSEKSIKRYMSGKGVTLAVIERLCAAAGMGFGELSELASAIEERVPPWTTDAQEAVLAAEPKVAIVLALLSSGWTPAGIEAEGLASNSDMNAILLRLDQLGAITLYPNNRVRLRVRIRPLDTASPPLRRVIAEAGARVMASLDLTDPAAIWRLNYARLGPASIARVAGRLDAFLAEVAELDWQDRDLGGDQVKWYAICGVATEHEVLGLRRLKEAFGSHHA